VRRRAPKPARRKAKQERSRETIDALLEAAAQVLLRDGYARATTNRIAERAGVSVGSIYQYFRDKDELFDALIRSRIDALRSAITGFQPDPRRSLESVLGELFLVAIRSEPHGPELLRVLECVPNAALRRRIAEAKGHVVGFVRSLLESYQDRLRVRDLDLAAYVVVNAAEGLGYNASRELFGQRLAAEAATLFARYLLLSAGEGRMAR